MSHRTPERPEPDPSAEARERAEAFAAEEDRVLSAQIGKSEKAGAGPETATRRRWKKAVLEGITFMVLLSPLAPESFAQRERTTMLPDGTMRVRVEIKTDPADVKADKKKANELRHMLDDKQFQKQIARIEEVYGGAAPHFLRLVASEENDTREFEGVPESTKIVRNGVLAAQYDLLWNKGEIIKRAGERRKTPRVAGFEALPGWSDKKAASLLGDFPPELLNNVDEVRYVDEEESTVVYSVAGQAYSIGIQGMLPHKKGNDATIYRSEGIGKRSVLLEKLAHEIVGHENDWETSNRLSMKERVEMLDEITSWLLDRQRPRDEYIDEKIPQEYKENGWDEREMKYRQARELWARIIEGHAEKFTSVYYPELKRKIENDPAAVPQDVLLADKWLNEMRIPAYTVASAEVRGERSDIAEGFPGQRP
ncbi:MAG TPA: hypothetical protein VNG29_01890 [Candidatus Paceibacterota bacterium]|nr:hypothetical protein [Candidatus Paceibacterota bacterium]